MGQQCGSKLLIALLIGYHLSFELTRTRHQYEGGDEVVYGGHLWTAKWWSYGDVPGGQSTRTVPLIIFINGII